MFRLLTRAIKTDDPVSLEQALRWLYSFVRPQRRAIGWVILLSLGSSLLVLAQPWLTKMLIDDGLLAKDYQALVHVAMAMIAVGLVSTLLSGVNRYLHTRLSGRILFNLRDDIYQHLQTLSPAFYGRTRIGDLMARLDGDVAQIQRFAVDSLFSALSSVLGLCGALALMFTLSWQLSLIVLLLIPIEVLWLRWMRVKVERRARRLRERSSDLSSFLVETLPAMKFIQSVGQERRESGRLTGLGHRYLDDLLKLQVTEFVTQAVPGTLTSWSRAGAFLLGGLWVIEGSWQLGALIAFSTYLGMAIGPVQSLLGLYVAIQRMTVSLTRVMELRQANAEVVQPNGDAVLALSKAGGVIEFKAVHFSYSAQQSLLQDINLRIESGVKVALSGASGGGKSTLIDLLQRHYDPQQGAIYLDGVDIRRADIAQLRRRVAVVSQDIVLFKGSIADNIRYAAPGADDQAVQQALQQAQLSDFVSQLPQGMDTPIGERGAQLSGGQKQRIAIARALLQQPTVLVLDEATSAVDEQTEQEIISAVDQLFADCTRVLISHRSSTLSGADQVLLLKDGRVLEQAEVSIYAE